MALSLMACEAPVEKQIEGVWKLRHVDGEAVEGLDLGQGRKEEITQEFLQNTFMHFTGNGQANMQLGGIYFEGKWRWHEERSQLRLDGTMENKDQVLTWFLHRADEDDLILTLQTDSVFNATDRDLTIQFFRDQFVYKIWAWR